MVNWLCSVAAMRKIIYYLFKTELSELLRRQARNINQNFLSRESQLEAELPPLTIIARCSNKLFYNEKEERVEVHWALVKKKLRSLASIKFYCGHFKPFSSRLLSSIVFHVLSSFSFLFTSWLTSSTLLLCVFCCFEGRFNGQFYYVPTVRVSLIQKERVDEREHTEHKLTIACNKFSFHREE